MDVLNPELIWIGSRCYRVNIPNTERKQEEIDRVNYENEDNFECGEYEADDFYEIEIIDNGTKFQLKVHVPQMFHSQIIGTKGTTKKRLEQETSCQIIVPKINSKDTNVIIKGISKRNVMSAKNRLDLIMIAGRSKMQFTHFLSISFAVKDVIENFNKFKSEVLSDPEIFGIDESLFQNPQKLHLTITMLSLLDNEDRTIAAEFLQDCKEMIIEPILQNGSLKVKLMGLNYMNDDPSSVDVLYGNVISEQLQEISDAVAEYFASRGFTQQRTEHVKLHVTLINSLFRDNDDAVVKDENLVQSREKKKKSRESFDASQILKKFKNFYFGEFVVKEVQLSQRFSKASNGYYKATGILKI